MALMNFDVGGAETHVLELSKSLKECGNEVFVASNGGAYVKFLEKNDIKHFKVPMHSKKLFNILKSLFKIKEIIEKENINIIHAHARIPAFLCGILFRFFNKTNKFNFVTTIHGCFKCGFLTKRFTNWGEKTLAVSEDLKMYLVKNYKIQEKNIKLTVNGINAKKFSGVEEDSSFCRNSSIDDLVTNNIQNILHVSRLTFKTDLVANKIIEVAEELSLKIKNLEITIVGNGNAFKSIQKKVKKINLKHKKEIIKLVGNQTNIKNFLSRSKIFIGVSRAALEAMSFGKPVILAGQEGYLGIFNKSKIKVAAFSNFCCRKCGQIENKIFANDIFKLINLEEKKIREMEIFNKRIVNLNYSVKKMRNDALEVYKEVVKNDNLSKNRGRKDNDVLISGYYGYRNNGDESILEAIINDLKELKPDIKIVVLSSKPLKTSLICGVKSVNRFSLLKIFKILNRTKLLISGGGCLIQDETSTRSLLYYLLIIKIAQIKKAKVMLYANGIGPIKNEKNKIITKKILNQCDVITVRDPISQDEIKNLSIDKPKILLTADPIFSFSFCQKKEVNILKNLNIKIPYFIITVRDLKFEKDNLLKAVLKFCDYVLEKYKIGVIPISMHYEQDVKISKKILKNVNSKIRNISREFKTYEIIQLIKNSEFVVGMRLHSIMYAYLVNVPFIGIICNEKIRSFIISNCKNYKNSCEMKNISFEKLKNCVESVMKDKKEKNNNFENIIIQKEKSKLNAKIAVEMIEKYNDS
jgi:polysaccharide pyruvyl transferase CsaB